MVMATRSKPCRWMSSRWRNRLPCARDVSEFTWPATWRGFTRGSKFMERFRNFVFQFCGLKTCLPRRLVASKWNGDGSQTKAGAFSLPCRAVAGRRREPFLSRRLVSPKSDVGGSVTKAEALVSVLGKFGGADQLRNAVNQFQSIPIRKCHNSRTLSFSGFRGHGGVVWYEHMNALKETIIEKLDSLPDPTLRQVMDYLTFLTWRGAGEEPSLLSVAGGLSGAPMSGAEIDRELYGQRGTR
jgi:hypothetical protein